MIKHIKLTSIIFVLITLFACGIVNKNRLSYYGKFDESMRKSSVPLRTDGFYHYDYVSLGDTISTVIVFYNDGMYFQSGSRNYYKLTNILNPILEISDHRRNLPWCWGSYIIEQDTIKMQTFSSYRSSFFRDIDEFWTVFENDTTIRFIKVIAYNETMWGTFEEEYLLDDIFYFKRCGTKPDSMNSIFFGE